MSIYFFLSYLSGALNSLDVWFLSPPLKQFWLGKFLQNQNSLNYLFFFFYTSSPFSYAEVMKIQNSPLKRVKEAGLSVPAPEKGRSAWIMLPMICYIILMFNIMLISSWVPRRFSPCKKCHGDKWRMYLISNPHLSPAQVNLTRPWPCWTECVRLMFQQFLDDTCVQLCKA